MIFKEKESTPDLDEVDLKILRILQEDSRISNTKLAQAVNLSETPCWRRWKRLEEYGLISRYRAVLDRRKLGFGVVAFVNVTFQTHNMDPTMEFEKKMQELDWIIMCHCITGSVDYLVQMVASDLDEFGERINALRLIPGVNAIQSQISVNEVKETSSLPLSR